MKKKRISNLKINKVKIADFNKQESLKGGTQGSIWPFPCDEADTFNTHCPDLSQFGDNC